MSLGPIDKKPIKSSILKPDQRNLLVFRNLDTVFPKKLKIEKSTGQFEESKKLSFGCTRVSSKTPVISDKELKNWLLEMIKVPVVGDEPDTLLELEPRKDIRKEMVKCYFSDIRRIANHFPKLVNDMMYNYDIRVYILPRDGRVYNFFKERGVEIPKDKLSAAKMSPDRSTIELKVFIHEEGLFGKYSKFHLQSNFAHEFLHLVDFCAVNPSEFTSQNLPVCYSETLNKRLGGKLEAIARRQNKNAVKTREERKLIPETSPPQEYLKTHKRNKSLTKILKTSGFVFSYNPPEDFNVEEVFAYSLDLYFKDKELLREIEPEMFEIIEKYILPDLR